MQCLRAVLARHHQFGEQRVEVPTDDVSRAKAGVDSHTRTAGHLPRDQGAGSRKEAATGVLAVDPKLDRMAANDRIVGADHLASSDAELLSHEIDAGDLFADRVLHLESGVDLEEGDHAVFADEELARSGSVVAGLFHDRFARLIQGLLLLRGQEGRGRLFDELLMSSLQRAVACGHHDGVAVLVGEHLRFHVTRAIEVALHETLPATESSHCFANGRVIQLGNLLHSASHLQPSTATAERGLDGDRKTEFLCESNNVVRSGDGVGGARNLRRASALSDVSSRHLVTEVANRLRWWPDPGEAGVDDRLRKVCVLGQEAIPRMDAVRPGSRRGIDDLGDVQVRLRGCFASKSECLVGHLRVHGVSIGVGVDGDRRQAFIATGANDPHGDFASIGDQDFSHSRRL